MSDKDCLFCNMLSRQIPVDFVSENELAFAIRDINPRAPVHVLIIPREHISDAREILETHHSTLGAMFDLAKNVAVAEGVLEDGYRLSFNVGDAAGMTISHLHLHLFAGRGLGPEVGPEA
tara:strand:- start:223 stop:582 length:360 start_codon:yes stop_codon:yes gene_type:complete